MEKKKTETKKSKPLPKVTKVKGGKIKRKVGRPTLYTEDMPQRVLDWLETCVDEEFEFHKTRGANSDSYERKLRVKLPTIQGLSLHLDLNLDTIQQWDKDPSKKEFTVALEKVRKAQHDKLIAGAVSGDYNSTIAKLLLMSNHGYKEKSETETNIKVSVFGMGHKELQQIEDKSQ